MKRLLAVVISLTVAYPTRASFAALAHNNAWSFARFLGQNEARALTKIHRPVSLPFHTSTSQLLMGRNNRGGSANDTTAKKKTVKKENLPTKICVVCNRPFNWRKKWERCWDEVTCCSKSCNAKRRNGKREVVEEND